MDGNERHNARPTGCRSARLFVVKYSVLLAIALVWISGPIVAADSVVAYVFWQPACPHCADAKAALANIAAGADDVRVETIELGRTAEAEWLFTEVLRLYGVAVPAVPLVIIGDRHFVGYIRAGGTDAAYREAIAACRAGPCPDYVASLAKREPVGADAGEDLPVADSVSLPWFGEVRLRDLSLPVLTIVLAGIDGFNPCAMWVLALLIGLLLGVSDSRRMWTLGLVFLLATGAMYFAVMAAWLNVVLWIGAISWIRIAIGALAVGAGLYYLHEYQVNPEGVCRVTPSGRRRSISEAFRSIIERPSLLVASLGIAALAITVNLVELVCSAGVPAIYTQMLAMHDLPTGGYYAYLAFYLLVFLFDDVAIFVVAMVTFRSAVATGRYSRFSHLAGGIVLLALGAVMLLRPEWLS